MTGGSNRTRVSIGRGCFRNVIHVIDETSDLIDPLKMSQHFGYRILDISVRSRLNYNDQQATNVNENHVTAVTNTTAAIVL
jgi:hypothetical protein